MLLKGRERFLFYPEEAQLGVNLIMDIICAAVNSSTV